MILLNKIRAFTRRLINDFRLLFGRYNVVAISGSKGYDGDVIRQNWGDDINYFFVKEISKKPIILLNDTFLGKYFVTNYLIIGSTIGMISNNNSIIWGAGLIDEDMMNSVYNIKYICAVRGPKTRQCLIENGYDCPAIYGDPALLIPLIYFPEIRKKHKLGVVCHYNDAILLENMGITDNKEIKIINPSKYNHWHDFIDEILSCEYIISSSLHGIIIGEAYKIKTKWIEFRNADKRSRFKYYDFYESIGKTEEIPMIIDTKIDTIAAIDACQSSKVGHINLIPLIESCPFEISLQ